MDSFEVISKLVRTPCGHQASLDLPKRVIDQLALKR
jgi:hypothetical protein